MIREYLRLFAKTAVACFVVAHALAIGVYALPGDATDPVSDWLTENAASRVAPYLLVTSQWQQWNLFAPNPLRRIVYYRIETENALGEWAYVTTINHTTYSPWRHSVHFKLLGQALEEETSRPELAERAVQVFCDEYDLGPDTHVRVWHDVTIIPYVRPSPGTAWWNTWVPQFESSLAADTYCQA